MCPSGLKVRFFVGQDGRFCVVGHEGLGGFAEDDHVAQPADVPPLIGASRDPNPSAKIRVDRFGLGIQTWIAESIQIDHCFPPSCHPW